MNKDRLFAIILSGLVPATLALNFYNFYWLDAVFILVTLFVLYIGRSSPQGWVATFGLKNRFLLLFLSFYLVANFLGYATTTPMGDQEWQEVAGFRWVWGFFAFYALGVISASYLKKIQWHFGGLIFVLLMVLYKHHHLTGSIVTETVRLNGFYNNPNYFALAAALVWAFVLPFALYREKSIYKQSGPFIALLLTTICLLSTYSRTSWIGIACALVVALFYSKNKSAIIFLLVLAGLSAVAISSNLFQIKDRLLHSFDFSSYNSQTARWIVWKSSWQMFLDHPWFGVGFEHSSRLHPEYYVKIGHPDVYVVRHAHNQFLDVLSGSGPLGLIGYLGMFIGGYTFFHRKLKEAVEVHKKQIALGSLLCIVTLFACSITDAPFRLHEARNYVLIILGFSYGYLANQRTSATASADS